MKCNVGDKVRIISGDYTGRTGTIVEDDGTAVPYLVRLDGSSDKVWMREARVEKVLDGDNYICINGNKAPLTEEQMRKLGIEPPKKEPFTRVDEGEDYYYIDSDGEIESECDDRDEFDDDHFNFGNYSADKETLEQIVPKVSLFLKLSMFAARNGGAGLVHIDRNVDGSPCAYKYSRYNEKLLEPTFKDEATAKRAIDEVITPFIAAHPGFKW